MRGWYRLLLVVSAVGLVVTGLVPTESAAAAPPPVDLVIVGGEGVVTADVEAQLKTCTTGSVTRIAGTDRYQTAAGVSASVFASSTGAYIATGKSFPDALAGAPAAAKNGAPLLLVHDTVPGVVWTELARLGVDWVVALGGPGAVPDSILDSLRTEYTASRLAGNNRYETAARIVQNDFATADVVYIATGDNFPDALAGGAAAGSESAPILLVQPDNIPAPTANQLKRLNPSTIKILGGYGAVSAAVESKLHTYASSVVRLSGNNRYETAAQISKHAFAGGATKVYIATGLSYPDALGAGPAAGVDDAPILLTQPDALPAPTENELQRLTGVKCQAGVVARGSGSGDNVVSLTLPNEPLTIRLTHDGSRNFIVWSLDAGLGNVDLLANAIGSYSGTRPMQFPGEDRVAALEIHADGNWTYEIRTLSTEPATRCPVSGSGDSVAVISDFATTARTASLTHTGSRNFIIWTWSSGEQWPDLVVNEIGPYSGTVAIQRGHTWWDISADGAWSIDC